MSSNIIQIEEAQFADTVGTGVTLIDFWAPWCSPCLMQLSILEQVAEVIGDKVKICKMNVDENQLTAANFGIQSIPTLLLFKNGEMKRQFVGVQRRDDLLQCINEIMD